MKICQNVEQTINHSVALHKEPGTTQTFEPTLFRLELRPGALILLWCYLDVCPLPVGGWAPCPLGQSRPYFDLARPLLLAACGPCAAPTLQ